MTTFQRFINSGIPYWVLDLRHYTYFNSVKKKNLRIITLMDGFTKRCKICWKKTDTEINILSFFVSLYGSKDLLRNFCQFSSNLNCFPSIK